MRLSGRKHSHRSRGFLSAESDESDFSGFDRSMAASCAPGQRYISMHLRRFYPADSRGLYAQKVRNLMALTNEISSFSQKRSISSSNPFLLASIVYRRRRRRKDEIAVNRSETNYTLLVLITTSSMNNCYRACTSVPREFASDEIIQGGDTAGVP
ncbi:hypothetical protein PUN28_013390 [Cardiocondyla obscurior]|uniref:Uncharacterized protein n=1 Tax=Cardiocondyla obscurior TaxID=286306 RepID=A0AAW2FB59_9HYME